MPPHLDPGAGGGESESGLHESHAPNDRYSSKDWTPPGDMEPQPGSPWSADPADPLVPNDFSSWFQKSMEAGRRAFYPLAALYVVTGLPGVLYGGFGTPLQPAPQSGMTMQAWLESIQRSTQQLSAGNQSLLLALAMLTLVMSFVVVTAGPAILAMRSVDKEVDWTFGFRYGLRRFWPTVGAYLVIGAMMLVGFGLLVLPGLVLSMVVTAALSGVLTFERGAGAFRTLRLTGRQFPKALGRGALVLLTYMLTILMDIWMGGFVFSFAGQSVVAGAAAQMAGLLFSLPMRVLTTAMAVVTYAELRSGEAPVTAATLVDGLEAR